MEKNDEALGRIPAQQSWEFPGIDDPEHPNQNVNYPELAKTIALGELNSDAQRESSPRPYRTYRTDELYVVWFAKTLKDWKALVGSVRADGIYIELTHNGAKGETYVDVYTKFSNTVVLDADIFKENK